MSALERAYVHDNTGICLYSFNS